MVVIIPLANGSNITVFKLVLTVVILPFQHETKHIKENSFRFWI